MDEQAEPTVWGVFVGERGEALESFNSKAGPFPPARGSEGWIAIGWAGMGDMKMFEGEYDDFVEKFRKLHHHVYDSERTLKTAANMVWNFAFSMKPGDYVICPSSTSGFVLIGRITGAYESDATKWDSVAKHKKRHDLMHLRKVEWDCSIPAGDPRYEKINRIGQLTVVSPNISVADLRALIA